MYYECIVGVNTLWVHNIIWVHNQPKSYFPEIILSGGGGGLVLLLNEHGRNMSLKPQSSPVLN